MPDSQKKSQKQKPEAKEQRKPRQGKKQQVDIQSKNEKIKEKTISEIPCTRVTGSVKPEYEEPPLEFYKNLKRETDEILKITEEANSKYKKKEIISNWAKYEMPIESYDDIEEQDMGADFEQLIQASMSVGGHFQFKHEKSWDQSTAPSLYDKYFDINSSNLATALYTIPFYERNCIDKSMFTQPDILNMDSRTARHKQKYFNDKSFAPEADSLEDIQRHLKEGLTFQDSKNTNENNETSEYSESFHIDRKKLNEVKHVELNTHPKPSDKLQASYSPTSSIHISTENNIDDIIFGKLSPVTQIASIKFVDLQNKELESGEKNTHLESKGKETLSEMNAQCAMETPEDLEKWLDDFLDG